MDNDIMIYDVPKAHAIARRNNYTLKVGNAETTLIRDVDFGKVPKAKTPSLYKSGAEKVLMLYGLYYDVIMVDSYKDHAKGYFYYEHKAVAYGKDGNIIRVGYGCANTSESGTGTASGFNTANSTIKKSRKRAVVDLALTLGCLSDAFTQDMESDFVEEQSKAIQKEEDFLTAKQIKRIFAIASANEISVEKAKELLLSWGYESTKTIKLKDYDTICEKLQQYNKEKQNG